MNWRNPFLVTYLSVTAAGTLILGYLVYSAWSNAQQVDADYVAAVSKLQGLQNRAPFPSDENNVKYIDFTKQYRAEYDKLVTKIASMQKPLETLTPQAFQDRLRSDVSQVEQAAKDNNVKLQEGFYLGFDQYRGTLPSDEAAGPLGRELAAIRGVVDQLIQLKVREITGIKRELLPQEGGAPAEPASGRTNRPPGGSGRLSAGVQPAQNIVNKSNFEISFVADQAATRAALNAIAESPQFFIIRYLNVENSAQEGPLRVDPNAAPTPDPAQQTAAPGAEQPAALQNVAVLAGRETLTVSLRIEMITFNNLPSSTASK